MKNLCSETDKEIYFSYQRKIIKILNFFLQKYGFAQYKPHLTSKETGIQYLHLSHFLLALESSEMVS